MAWRLCRDARRCGRAGARAHSRRRPVRQRLRPARHQGRGRREPAHREREPRARSAIRFRGDRKFDRAVRQAERAVAAHRREVRAAHHAGHRPARAARHDGLFRAASSESGRAGDHRRCRLVHARSGAAAAASVSVLALWREQVRLRLAHVFIARAAPRGAAADDPRRAAPAERGGRLLGLREGRPGRIPAGDDAARRWRAGAARREREFPRRRAARCGDQETAGRLCRSCCSCRRPMPARCRVRARSRRPRKRRARPR